MTDTNLASSKANKDEAAIQAAGRAGEQAVKKRLEALPEEFHVLHDLLLKSGYGTAEIDHLIVCPYGVFVIETKNYTGLVQGTDKDRFWTQNGRNFFNPVRQNYTHIEALRQILKPVVGGLTYVSAVVFAGSAELAIKSRANVMKEEELLPWLTKDRTPVLSDEKQEKILTHLKEKNITDPAARKRHSASVRRKNAAKLKG